MGFIIDEELKKALEELRKKQRDSGKSLYAKFPLAIEKQMRRELDKMKVGRFNQSSPINKKLKNNIIKKTKQGKTDPHHCTCFSISKLHFRHFETTIKNLGYSEPFFEDDHGQIIGFTKRLSENYQIHVKLMRTGKIEAEIEYPQDYPMAHLNPAHSFSAHPELNLLLIAMQIPYKRKRIVPVTCIHRQIIPAQTPTHRDTFLTVGGGLALLDIIFNDGKITGKALDVLSKQVDKSIKRKIRRKKYL